MKAPSSKTTKALREGKKNGKGKVERRGRKANTTRAPLGIAMADRGLEGPAAANYLKHALGLSRSRAYELLAGQRELSEEQAKLLVPLLSADGVTRLRDEVRRQVIAEAEAIARELGNATLAKALAVFAKKTFGSRSLARAS